MENLAVRRVVRDRNRGKGATSRIVKGVLCKGIIIGMRGRKIVDWVDGCGGKARTVKLAVVKISREAEGRIGGWVMFETAWGWGVGNGGAIRSHEEFIKCLNKLSAFVAMRQASEASFIAGDSVEVSGVL